MHIRLSTNKDLDALMPIFQEAQTTIATLGIDQWQDGYPNRSVIAEDISLKISYVAEVAGEVCGTFVLTEEEPTYDRIYHGHWLTGDDNRNYIALHRVAIPVRFRGQGIATDIIDYATHCAQCCGKVAVRVDTHRGNLVMRRMLEKNGFIYCGVICLQSGAQRVAYEKPVLPF